MHHLSIETGTQYPFSGERKWGVRPQDQCMPRRARLVLPGVAHHVTQRGNNRQHVFFSDEDRAAYLDRMFSDSGTAWIRPSRNFRTFLYTPRINPPQHTALSGASTTGYRLRTRPAQDSYTHPTIASNHRRRHAAGPRVELPQHLLHSGLAIDRPGKHENFVGILVGTGAGCPGVRGPGVQHHCGHLSAFSSLVVLIP